MASHKTSDFDYMAMALAEARKSPPKPSNFCVGAVIVSPSAADPVLATGYTLEEAGNTHAEQSAFIKLARSLGVEDDNVEEALGPHLPTDSVLYTTMEPCNKRSPGNTPCVERILALKGGDGTPALRRVCVGVSEPTTFVGVNEGRSRLEQAGITFDVVTGLEDDINRVATAGHIADE